MEDLTQFYTALKNADAAGDVEAAKALASHIQQLSSSQSAPSNVSKSTYGDFARTLNDSLKAAGKATSGQSQLGRGFQDVLDSAALGTAWARDKLGGNGNYDAVKADINAINQDYEQSVPNGSGMRVASNIVATLPVGGLLAKSVGGGAGALPTALRTGGMSTGAVLPEGAKWLGAKGADMALRTAAAGAVGTAGGAMINPDEALKSGGISALMPAVFKVAGAAGKYIGSKLTPDQQLMIDKLAKMTGQSVSDIKAKMTAAMSSTAGTYEKNYRPAQLLNEPAFTQAEIVARAKSPKLSNQFYESDLSQNANALNQIEGIAPTYGSHNEAAANAGNAIQDYAFKRESQLRDLGKERFNRVDPNNESLIDLPIGAMRKVKDEFLGEGVSDSFKKEANKLLSQSEKISTQPYVPYVQSQKTGANGLLGDISAAEAELSALGKETSKLEKNSGRTLAQEVRSLGGIKGGNKTNELSDLSRKNSGTTGLVNNKSGMTAERMVEELRQRGVIDHGDPSKLIAQLQDEVRGIRHTPTTDTSMIENGWQAKANKNLDSDLQNYIGEKKSALDDYLQSLGNVEGSVLPPSVKTMPKQVPFKTLQDQRYSYGETASNPNLSTREAAAISAMRGEIDKHLGDVISGAGGVGENFTQDMGRRYGKANQKWEDLQNRFKTGAQSGIFAERNGQPLLQGAQIADKFYNSGSKQIENMVDFKRLIGYNEGLSDELKKVAMTKAKEATTADGSLSGAKLNSFIKNYSGANKGLLSEAENSKLAEVLADVQRRESATKAGLPRGQSWTMEKQAAVDNLVGNGLLDSSLMNFLAYKVPGLRMAGAPMHSAAKTALEGSRANQLAELMSNTPNFMKQLEAAGIREEKQKITDNLMQKILPLTYRAAPAIAAQ